MATSITNTISYEGQRAAEILFDPLVGPSAQLSDFTILPTVTRKIQVPEIAGLTGGARDGASCNTTTVGSVTTYCMELSLLCRQLPSFLLRC
jgi:hypothetical protein